MMKKTTIILAISIILFAAFFIIYQNINSSSSSSVNITTTDATLTMQLRTTVQAFLMSTLGTLSDGTINLDMAAELTTPQLAQQITNPDSLPIIYGIQQGPDDISIGQPQIIGQTAIVNVDGLWREEIMQSWTFELTPDSSDIWRISNITPVE